MVSSFSVSFKPLTSILPGSVVVLSSLLISSMVIGFHLECRLKRPSWILMEIVWFSWMVPSWKVRVVSFIPPSFVAFMVIWTWFSSNFRTVRMLSI